MFFALFRNYIRFINLILIFFAIQQQNVKSAKFTSVQPTTTTTSFLIDKILNTLEYFMDLNAIDINIKFGALLAEFLIKQKVRFYESNRYEDQMHYSILQKLNAIIEKPLSKHLKSKQQQILRNIFQRNILLTFPTLKTDQIDIHLEYKSLAAVYSDIVEYGIPNATLSDSCLLDIVTLEDRCNQLRDECMSVMITNLPSFGYQRMHQILILYVFMHHQCSQHYHSLMAYELLAGQKCNEVYREHNAIKALGIPQQYRDLYLEQNVICGLFGYVEYVNWPNLRKMIKWIPDEFDNNSVNNTNDNYYEFLQHENVNDHIVSNIFATQNKKLPNYHMKSLALVYYINCFLLLT